MGKIKALTGGILLTAATMIASPTFGQQTNKIITNTKTELVEAIPDDIGDYPIKRVEKHFGKEKMAEIIQTTSLKRINEIRKENGSKPLVIEPRLTNPAQKYSEEMFANTRYNHIGKDGSTPMKRAARTGYISMYMLENIGYNYYSINDAITHRKNSPGHFRNMIDPDAVYLGIGYCEGYRVNMFSGENKK